jgi:ribonucleoside-triphosphate reductase
MSSLNPQQLQQKIAFITQYQQSNNAADASNLDANANVTHKNIATLETELMKDYFIDINRALVKQKIADLFVDALAEEYIRQIVEHEIYVHDETSLKPYCASISMYPFLLNGLTQLGGESKAPQHLESFCGSFVNLVFAISAQFAGAIATVEFLIYFDYFARKDYGEHYLHEHRHAIENHLQHVVYALNQPAAARGYQSVFWNISIYDQHYFDAMFGQFVFPDITEPDLHSISELKAFLIDWYNRERSKAVLTFQYITAAMLTDQGKEKYANLSQI